MEGLYTGWNRASLAWGAGLHLLPALRLSLLDLGPTHASTSVQVRWVTDRLYVLSIHSVLQVPHQLRIYHCTEGCCLHLPTSPESRAPRSHLR